MASHVPHEPQQEGREQGRRRGEGEDSEPKQRQQAQGAGEPAQGERQGGGQDEESRSQQGEMDFESLREHGRAVRTAAQELREASQQALAEAERMARTSVRERPYTTLGAAFAVGWVLGGGVPIRLATFATGAVGRAAIGLAASRLAEMQASGPGAPGQRRGQTRGEGANTRESGAHARM